MVELSVMPVLGDPVSFSGLHRHQIHTCRQKQPSTENKISLKSKMGGVGLIRGKYIWHVQVSVFDL